MRQVLVFAMLTILIVWFSFSSIYKDVLITRHQELQQEADYLLEIGGRLGYISNAMIQESKQRLHDRNGFDMNLLQYTVTSLSGAVATNPSNPLPRGDGLVLEISYPYLNAFSIDRLIGISGPSSTERYKARGIQMSEYYP